MNNDKHNKFETVHNNLIEFCDKCKLSRKANCILYDHKCSEFSEKYTEFYYNIMYPFHPCKECLAIDDCVSIKPCACTAYWHFCRMRLVAECEIKNNVVFFSNKRQPVIFGSADLLSEQYLRSEDFYRNAIDFQVTADYTAEIKSDPIYAELLSTVRQYLEYRSIYETDNGKTEFIEDFYII